MDIQSVVQITGQVIDNASDSGMGGLNIEVWDSAGAYPQALVSGQTDDNGRFTLRFDPRQFKMDTVPDLYFKVLDGENLLTSTEDQVVWNSNLQEDATIYIVAPKEQPTEPDKYTGLQMLTITNFVRQSDFSGLFSQLTGAAGTSLGFVRDMFANSFSLDSLERSPITVTAKREDILGQPVEVASRNLKDQDIGVGQVLNYNPRLNTASLSLLGSQPINLKAGQTVDLYQQDGTVKYYSLSSANSTTGSNGSTPGGIAGGPTGSPGSTNPTSPTEFAQLREELNSTKATAAQKDEQLSKLQEELASLRKDQNDLKALIQSKFPG